MKSWAHQKMGIDIMSVMNDFLLDSFMVNIILRLPIDQKLSNGNPANLCHYIFYI